MYTCVKFLCAFLTSVSSHHIQHFILTSSFCWTCIQLHEDKWKWNTVNSHIQARLLIDLEHWTEPGLYFKQGSIWDPLISYGKIFILQWLRHQSAGDTGQHFLWVYRFSTYIHYTVPFHKANWISTTAEWRRAHLSFCFLIRSCFIHSLFQLLCTKSYVSLNSFEKKKTWQSRSDWSEKWMKREFVIKKTKWVLNMTWFCCCALITSLHFLRCLLFAFIWEFTTYGLGRLWGVH